MASKLIYLSHTQPNIAYAVSLISQFMHDPGEPHMQAFFHILHYFKSALEKGLLFSKYSHPHIDAFTNTDWAESLDNRG